MIVIPARMASTRFPGKPLCDLLGKPMVQWVYERALASGVADRVMIAAPDQEIIDAARSFGAEAMLTSLEHPSGTDRLAEVAAAHEADVYINVQGDEPLIKPTTIRACAEPLLRDGSINMSSVWAPCLAGELDNSAVVKVVCDLHGDALYFSRFALPFARNERLGPVRKHIGIYGFRRQTLIAFAGWEQTPLERAESLEQLRFLEHGVKIRMAEGEGSELAVDTPEQAEEVRQILSSRT